jgi:RNA polymerase sigma factor (sigma-70 family)
MAQAQLGPVVRHLRKLAAGLPEPGLTDAQLLHHFRVRRDEGAFAALVARHGRLVLAVCRQVLRHAQDAEDAFQATFLVLARQAGSIRRTEAIGSWLYRVAYRVATKAGTAMAKRRIHERRVNSVPPREPSSEAAWREIQAVLREEVERLPEKYRAPFVLCCLEGQSGAEAARQLGWKEGTVTGRLTLARRRLQDRLARRGITLTAVLAGLALARQTRAAVPSVLLQDTVQAAVQVAGGELTAGLVSEKVAVLTETAAGHATGGKIKLAALLLLAVSALAAGAGAMHLREPEAPPTPPSPRQREADAKPSAVRAESAKPKPAPALEEDEHTVAVNGRVLDPDGKPFAGAEVFFGWYYGYALPWYPPVVQPFRPRTGATSGPDGRFRVSFTKAEGYAALNNPFERPWRFTQVVAAAKGYGPGWAWLQSLKGDLTLRLVKDDVPARGRVLDLQGRPVAGARVWLDHLTGGRDYLSVGSWAGLTREVTTAKDGRFVLTGLGRDREAHIHIDGPTIEHKLAKVGTRPAQAPVEVVVGPTKPVVGTVRALDTGKPLAGAIVYGSHDLYREGLRAVTDVQGRYRLVGLPKAASYEVMVCPRPGQPYLRRSRRVADSEGLKPVREDFALRRGVPARFRLVDELSGKPVRGAVMYTPLQDNPLYRESEDEPGLFPSGLMQEWHFAETDRDFHLVVYPGPGVILAWVQLNDTKYLPARIDPVDRQKGYYPSGGKSAMVMAFVELCQAYRIIDPAESDRELVFDIVLRPGRVLPGTLVGPDSKPVTGAMAFGLNFDPVSTRSVNYSLAHENQELKTQAFTATCLDPQGDRTLSFVHKEGRLIGHVVLEGSRKEPLIVRMQPWGALTGRLVGADGKPFTGIHVRLHYPRLASPGLRPPDGDIVTDADGRFRVEALVPGLKHELTLERGKDDPLSAGTPLKGLVVQPGETKDLGDIKVTAK